jgi:hypothetical protein
VALGVREEGDRDAGIGSLVRPAQLLAVLPMTSKWTTGCPTLSPFRYAARRVDHLQNLPLRPIRHPGLIGLPLTGRAAPDRRRRS